MAGPDNSSGYGWDLLVRSADKVANPPMLFDYVGEAMDEWWGLAMDPPL